MSAFVPLVSLEGNERTKVKVSSVLNRDVKQFGKKFMFDDHEETCWNSDQGVPQYVTLDLGRPAVTRELCVRFQGGFAGKECALMGGETEENLREIAQFYPTDSNSLQTFPLPGTGGHQMYRIVFKSTTDFFGRVTIYWLQLYGNWIEQLR